MRRDLGPLAARILALETAGPQWRLGAAEVARLLGVEEIEMIRRVYAAGDLEAATRTFGPEHGPELVTLAELLGARDAERVLRDLGLHLPLGDRVELVGLFLEHAARRLAGHSLDTARLEAMLRTLGRARAEVVYLEELPDLDTLRHEAAALWCPGRGFALEGLARRTSLRILELYFTRKVLRPDHVYAEIRRRIGLEAARLGYTEPRPRARAGHEPAPEERQPLEEALRTLGMEGQSLTRRDLRDRYRALMKRYHPDVNPRGLERCQEINAAYSLVAASMGR